LDLFNDKTFDDYTPNEWIEKGKEHHQTFKPIPGVGLYKGTRYEWRDILVDSYDPKEEKFIVRWASTGSKVLLSRIYILFDVIIPYLLTFSYEIRLKIQGNLQEG